MKTGQDGMQALDEERGGVRTALPRLTRLPFPAYPHLPGTTPHPMIDPGGHGGTAVRGNGTPVERLEAFLFGCDLYNHGYWWEAHEAWEGVWHALGRSGVRCELLKALIQAANAHLKVRMNRPRAVERLRLAVSGHLARVEDATDGVCLGVPVRDWGRGLDAYLRARVSDGRPRHDHASFPALRPAGITPDRFRDDGEPAGSGE